MTLTRERPELERPVESVEDLIGYFRMGEKPRAQWRVGTEHEKLGLFEGSLEPVPYEGPNGIRALFERLVRDYGFEAIRQDDLIVGLEREGTAITLEPGGALELGGAPLGTLHETCKEFRDHVALMKHVSVDLGILWLGLGVHPAGELADFPRMPHERYTVMRRILEKRGHLALHMMHTTAGVQASFDYSSEDRMARMLRSGLLCMPLVTAIYANSSISEEKPNGFESLRAWIWRHTDPARCGFPRFVFEDAWLEGDAYRQYAEWALDVPMFFIRREGRHVEMSDRTFRQFLDDRGSDDRPTLADWNLHLTTLFPEVRLKQLLEVRGADAVPPGLVCGLPAIFKGLWYDDESLAAALERLGRWTGDQVDALHADVARRGLSAEAPDGAVLEVAREIVDLAREGLQRLGHRNSSGEDESLLLEPVYEVLDRGKSPGRQLVERWEGAWSGRRELLVEYARY